MEQLNDKLLKDYLTGRCTQRQMEQVSQWMEADDEHARWLFRMEELYHAGRTGQYAGEARIQRAELRLIQAIRQQESESQKNRVVALRRWLQRAAVITAMVVIGAGAYNLFFRHATLTEVTADAGVRNVVLPDGTHVSLNKGARLSYPEHFGSGERTVHLSGEARFEVAKDAAHPFIVSSDAMSVRVLGTIFNFNTDSRNHAEEVTLLEGTVEATGLNGEGKIVLHPDQKVILDKHCHAMTTEQVYAPLETLWYCKKIPFRNMHITDIIHILAKDYEEDILMTGVDVNATYSGVVLHAEDIDSVLNNLRFSIPFNYERRGGKIYIIGK